MKLAYRPLSCTHLWEVLFFLISKLERLGEKHLYEKSQIVTSRKLNAWYDLNSIDYFHMSCLVLVHRLKFYNAIACNDSSLLWELKGLLIKTSALETDFWKLELTLLQLFIPNECLGSRVVNFVLCRNLKYFNEYLLYWVALLENPFQEHDFGL